MKKKAQEQSVVEAPVQLSLVNFDEPEAYEPEPVATEPERPQVGAATVDTEEQALATVESFDLAFANDPLKAEWLEFGNTARRYTDPSDKAALFVHLSQMQYNLMVKERNIAPGSYKR